jgi:hypothetical protein
MNAECELAISGIIRNLNELSGLLKIKLPALPVQQIAAAQRPVIVPVVQPIRPSMGSVFAALRKKKTQQGGAGESCNRINFINEALALLVDKLHNSEFTIKAVVKKVDIGQERERYPMPGYSLNRKGEINRDSITNEPLPNYKWMTKKEFDDYKFSILSQQQKAIVLAQRAKQEKDRMKAKKQQQARIKLLEAQAMEREWNRLKQLKPYSGKDAKEMLAYATAKRRYEILKAEREGNNLQATTFGSSSSRQSSPRLMSGTSSSRQSSPSFFSATSGSSSSRQSSPQTRSGKKWQCPACTFKNAQQRKTCEMCESPRASQTVSFEDDESEYPSLTVKDYMVDKGFEYDEVKSEFRKTRKGKTTTKTYAQAQRDMRNGN